MEHIEYIGYRANTFRVTNEKRGVVTVFAERNNNVSLGEYGGDAVPFTHEYKKNGVVYGTSVAADGVGQGAYAHPSLERFLNEYCKDNYPNLSEKEKDATMLYVFLTILYGEDFVKDQDALKYATACFSSVPKNGFFAANKESWQKYDDDFSKKTAKVGQSVLPFYKRDSQSLGSRIVCVGLFYKFRRYFENSGITVFNAAIADTLKTKIEKYINEDLSEKVRILFSLDDAPNATKRGHYFLCSTVAIWFYAADESSKTVSAISLNCGDARCYVADLIEGVRQISVDDAFPDGTMSAFVHYGDKPRNDSEYHDGRFHSRIVKLQYPCALFACSDGVYDTCPDEKRKFLPYGQESEANDFLFELNMLRALRNCYSIEDFRRAVVFDFYGQSNTNCGELAEAGNFEHVKKDDSGTLAGKFFGDTPIELFEKLRRTTKTFLDNFVKYLTDKHEEKIDLPYYSPRISSSEDKKKEMLSDYATGDFKSAIVAPLKDNYSKAFREMKENGINELWGIENCDNELTGFKLNQFVSMAGNLTKMLVKALERNAEGSIDDLPVYDNVLAIPAVKDALDKDDSFNKFVEKYLSSEKNEKADALIALYDKFKSAFYGNTPENYETQTVKNRLLPKE